MQVGRTFFFPFFGSLSSIIPKEREKIVAFLSTSRFPCHVIFILIVLGSRISSSHFHLFFFVPSLCIVCRDVNRCALLIFRSSWKHFRAVCFPFETQSGSLLLLAILAQGVAAMSEAAAMG